MAYCKTVKLPGGGVAIVRMGGRRPPVCAFCGGESTKLCDYRLEFNDQVRLQRTCDAPMCDRCATRVGVNRDYCPRHRAQEKLGF
jgi:hypothetical protein